MLSPDRLERLRGQLDSGRRRLDTARSHVGRIATAAGTAAATAGLFTPAVTGESLLATALATGAGLLVLPTGRAARRAAASDGEAPAPHHQANTAMALYAAPGVSLLGVLIAERIVPGVHWGEGLAVAVWSAGTFYLRPSRTARHLLVPPLPPLKKAAADLVVQEQPAYDHPAAQWWAEHVAVEGGPAPDTVLEAIEQTGERGMRAVIRSAIEGEPVPDISKRRLSARLKVPVELIQVEPLPGHGEDVQRLLVGEADEDLDARTLWATRIAPLAMPGASITSIAFGSMTTPTTLTKEIDA
ncbi:hypothetical protein [Streptomyces platensis]|uniref:hypothetical protein n=1 Tax=Streptomyces platensis TaxID=58346 RepID=UPI003790D31E